MDRTLARANRARMREVEGAGGRLAGANGILTPRTRRGGRARFKAHAWRACKLGRVSGVQLPPSPPTSLYILPTFRRRQKLRAKCGVLSTRSAPERASSRRIRPIRRAFSPCEVKTIRFQRLNVRRAAVRPTIAMPISLEWFRDSAVLADVRAPRQVVGVVPGIVHRRLSRQRK
jgi:hypothetical protein